MQNEHSMVKNPNWREADQLASQVTSMTEDLTLGQPRNKLRAHAEKDLDPRSPDFKSDGLHQFKEFEW